MYDNNYLSHHGIKGQKWGVRRFQNPDGSLTRRGMVRQAKAEVYDADRKSMGMKKGQVVKKTGFGSKNHRTMIKNKLTRQARITKRANEIRKDQIAVKKSMMTPEQKQRQAKRQKAAKVILGTVATMVAADYLSASMSGEANLTDAGRMFVATAKLGS